MTRRSKSGAMSTGARGNGYRRSCAPPARSGTRGATSACGRHVHSAAATTAAPALGSPCNNLCELSRPAAWLDMSPLACRRGLLSIIEQIMSDEKQIHIMLTTDCFPCLCLDVMEENC